jgi:hypothetical protein
MLYGSSRDWLHLVISLVDLSMKMGSVSSVLFACGPFRRIFIGYSPMHMMAWLGNSGLNSAICFPMLSRTSKFGLQFSMSVFHTSFKSGLVK